MSLPWPEKSLECERKFGGPHARLYPFVGKTVGTTHGSAKLLQVFANHAVVVYANEPKKAVNLYIPQIWPAG